ncbi:Magnesium transport protein CorA [Flagellimonas maritima]|uniref:Magnesium transport protein CorA n=1 Tax=Flagellimonas maritima TaxID=1383885 RepID=A0A2Z4LMV2_9FLAO|nr:CorA family divalent cation transporter [Allomuricauda aurantiaca]AWX43145.1 Magnesium transport protein CorA [Allomuricauda aurantiaca]
MTKDFENNTTVINYSAMDYYSRQFSIEKDMILSKNDKTVTWVNTYGFDFMEDFREMVLANNMDDFLLRLLIGKSHGSKVIELENQLFITAKIIKTENNTIETEQMFFVVAEDFVWCIQEKVGDHFDWIRDRIANNKGIIRKKRADYLLYFILETIISNYKEKYNGFDVMEEMFSANTKLEPTPEFMLKIEEQKQLTIQFKKSSYGLRDIMVKLERLQIKGIRSKYFSDLREQINGLLNDIDSDINELDSKVNLLFNIQGHRLNQVMKTLTIFSVIFIPLTFMAGIYGMNFENIPELRFKYGYFILLGVMLLVTLISILIFKYKKWF